MFTGIYLTILFFPKEDFPMFKDYIKKYFHYLERYFNTKSKRFLIIPIVGAIIGLIFYAYVDIQNKKVLAEYAEIINTIQGYMEEDDELGLFYSQLYSQALRNAISEDKDSYEQDSYDTDFMENY
jgi:hypothetical protein